MKRALPIALFALFSACNQGGGFPTGFRATDPGNGPRVTWDLEARPVPNIPLPNDFATWPDPGSPTGLRLNASLIAPTSIETRTRALFNTLDGWGTFAPITVAFDAPIDVQEMMRRQGAGKFTRGDWPEHAVYLINLATGIPVPLDVNTGAFTFNLDRPDNYGENDPRGAESNLLFETVEEDANQNGALDPGEDTDFDGVLDHPNTVSGTLDPSNPTDTYDNMLWFYERETNTLVLRPIIPMDENAHYAVVLTKRLVGENGEAVRSPFEYVHHTRQTEDLRELPRVLSAHPDLYGDLATQGWDGVAFAWAFTTQSITGDLTALRDGLYGRGPFAQLASDFPADLVVSRAINEASDGCASEVMLNHPYVAPVDLVKNSAEQLASEAFGLSAESTQALLDGFDSIDHFVVAFYRTPYLLGDPNAPSTESVFDIDRMTGRMRVSTDVVPMIIAIPKETESFHQPFPVAFAGHSYTSSNLEALGFAGLLAKQGVATVGIAAQAHGFSFDTSMAVLLRAVFGAQCLDGMGNALLIDRARDENGDRLPDSGGDFWSAYVFHTRDALRQSVLDEIQGIRVLRALDGFRLSVPGSVPRVRSGSFRDATFDGDFNQDGAVDIAGDFDSNGVPDFGGPGNPIFVWGQSLGAAITGTLAGVEPYATVNAPSAGAGGLIDVGLRTTESSVKEAVVMRLMSPVITSVPSAGPSSDTGCAAGDHSLRFLIVDLNSRATTEFGCAPADAIQAGDAVIARNFSNHETRCAAAGAEGRFRISLPSDQGDRMDVTVYRGGASDIDFNTCRFVRGESHELTFSIDEWTSGAATCSKCGRYQQARYEVGDDLVAPAEGFGIRRQTPELRRFMTLAQVAVDAGDPVNYAKHIFLSPLAESGPRNLLVLESLGDTTVPVNAGFAYARAAGVLPFLPASAPDVFADYRAPASFEERYPGHETPNELLNYYYVSEAIARLARTPDADHTDWLFDPDDLSEGQQYFADANGNPPIPPDMGFLTPRLSPPLRWVRESHATRSPDDNVWSVAPGTSISGLLMYMIEPSGEHGFDPVDPAKSWDEGAYLNNLLGWYFRSNGSDLLYHSHPAEHECLENSSCVYPGSF
ncbi:MAG: hypothetical protein IPK60_17625 [Sandaracinaceae bacterium]|nr:hypothetical protein [Sandaracinaceae bacterium]